MKQASPARNPGTVALCGLLGWLLLGASSGPGTAPESIRRRETGSFETLRRLVEIQAVSGHEAPVREAIRELMPGWARPAARIDSRGNLVLEVGREGKPILFIAHMDETGYEIASVEQDGTARVRSRGGFFNRLYEGHEVRVLGRKGEVAAVVRPREGYLSWEGGDAELGEAQVVVDFGTASLAETDALGVSPGDPVAIPKKFLRLAGGMGTGRSVDDRAGCTALLEALRRIDPKGLRNRVVFAWSVEEELGLHGAEALAGSLHPEIVFAVDTFVSSDSPLEEKSFALGLLGRGPVIRAIDNSNLAPLPLVERVRQVAASRGIPIQVGLTRGGNDGSVFPSQGAPDVPISWPTVYSHSAVEVLNERDLDDLGRLVQALAEGW
jgi:putative aminopeptidase